jgi:hypothetical protein
VGGGGGRPAPPTKSWRSEKILWNQQHPGEPVPWGQDDPASFANWKVQQGELQKDQTDALQKRPQYTQNLGNLRNKLGDIIGLKPGGNPDNSDDYDQGKQALLQSALSKPGAQAYLSSDPRDLSTQALGAALTPQEKALLDEVRDTTDPKQLFGSLSQRAPKRGQSDVTAIGNGLDGMRNIRKSPDNWIDGVKETITAADTATGNAYGASGEAEAAPSYTKPLIDPSYLQGGSMYPYGKKAAPMSQAQIDAANTAIKNAPQPEEERQKLIHGYLADNVDPTPLRKGK